MSEPKTISHSKAGALLEALGLALASAGTKQVDVTVRLSGTLTKGADYESAATVKTLSLATVGCILRHCGVTREAAIEAALTAVKMASAEGFKPNAVDAAWAEAFKAEVAAKLPPMECEGKRTGSLVVETIAAPIVGQASVELAREQVTA